MSVIAAIFMAIGGIILVAYSAGVDEPLIVDSAEGGFKSLVATPNPNNTSFSPTIVPIQPAVVPAYETYTVGAGDVLVNIAARYAVSVQEIVDLNGGINPDKLEIGQVLQIPVTANE